MSIIFPIKRILNEHKEIVSEEEERQKGVVEDLTDRYATLTEELQRNAKAREDMLVGAERQLNVGKSLQGADVGKLLQDVDQFQSVDPEARGVDKDAWKQTREDLMKTGLELVKIDKRFKTIALLTAPVIIGGRVALYDELNLCKDVFKHFCLAT